MKQKTGDNMRELIRQALNNPISEVYYEDHTMDNTFIRVELYKMEWDLEDREWLPIGYCAHPSYCPWSGIGFIVKDKDDNTIWAHVPKSVFKCWLRQLEENIEEHPLFKK